MKIKVTIEVENVDFAGFSSTASMKDEVEEGEDWETTVHRIAQTFGSCLGHSLSRAYDASNLSIACQMISALSDYDKLYWKDDDQESGKLIELAINIANRKVGSGPDLTLTPEKD